MILKIYMAIAFVSYCFLFYWLEVQDKKHGRWISPAGMGLALIWPLWAWIFVYAFIKDLQMYVKKLIEGEMNK